MTVRPIQAVEVRKDAVILVVAGSEEDLRSLHFLCEGSSWDLRIARNCEEARAWLSRNASPVVLSAQRLPDGDWKTVLRITDGLAKPPNLIVFSRQADDRFWEEVLNSGGYDVLAFPIARRDFFPAISSAWRNWRGRARGHAVKVQTAAHGVYDGVTGN